MNLFSYSLVDWLPNLFNNYSLKQFWVLRGLVNADDKIIKIWICIARNSISSGSERYVNSINVTHCAVPVKMLGLLVVETL